MNAHTRLLQDVPMHTMWGYADAMTPIADGIVYVSTPSHGGFWLNKPRLHKVPLDWRMSRFGNARTPLSPWFEHDCDWCFAVLAHEDAFDSASVAEAKVMFKRWGQERIEEFAA